MQFWLTSRLLGIRADLKRAFTITVLRTAGNLLPLPGGAAVRIAALKKSGEGYLRPTGLTIIVALFWMCLSSFVAFVALVLLGHTLLQKSGLAAQQQHAYALKLTYEIERPNALTFRALLKWVPEPVYHLSRRVFPTPIYLVWHPKHE